MSWDEDDKPLDFEAVKLLFAPMGACEGCGERAWTHMSMADDQVPTLSFNRIDVTDAIPDSMVALTVMVCNECFNLRLYPTRLLRRKLRGDDRPIFDQGDGSGSHF